MSASAESMVAKNESEKTATLLCVDDEASILTSLKRALRKQPYRVLTAGGGEEALGILENEPVDLVLSDMRMPGMSGAELLCEVNQRWPETVRMLLTGYSDMESTVSAINQGQIYRYLAKPWENADLIAAIDGALQLKRLRDENRELTELTRSQNEELKSLNDDLETKVRARTQEIARAAKLLRKSYAQLKDSLHNSISVFSRLLELREGEAATHRQNVAALARAVAEDLDLGEKATDDLDKAALLHDIGKLGFDDDLRATSYNKLDAEQLEIYRSHPRVGQAALLAIPTLDRAGEIIRAQLEQFNGQGFPDGLAGDEIAVESQILAIASDYDDLQNGIFLGESLNPVEAIGYIRKQSGTRYEPSLVKTFARVVESGAVAQSALKELKVDHRALEPDMVLTRNVVSSTGMLLLREGQVLNASLIERIHRFVEDAGASSIVFVSGTRAAAEEPVA